MQAQPDQLLGHPKGLYICFFTEMWERFSFYGMKALLFLYLTKYHLFGDGPSYDLLGAYGGLVYAMPVVGGILADRYLGMRKAVVLGGVLLCLGHFGMAFEGHAATSVDGVVSRDTTAISIFYLSLALIIGGVGFLKPNISTIVGKLYPDGDPRRDGGFTIFYAGINVGATFASLVCAFLGETYGWKYGFGAAGVGMLAGLFIFIWGQRYLQGHAEPSDPAKLRRTSVIGLSNEWTIYLAAIAIVLAVWLLLQQLAGWQALLTAFAERKGYDGHLLSLNVLMVCGAFGLFLVWFGWYVIARCNPEQRRQMLALIVLIFACLAYFTLYEQTYGSWVAFTDRLLTKDMFPSLVNKDGLGLPWGLWVLAASPLLMYLALRLPPGSRGGPGLMYGFAAAILIAILHDVVLLPQSAGSLTYLGSFFLVILAPLFTWLWPMLARRGLNPPTPYKMVFGLLFAGLSFIPLALAAQTTAGGEMASVWWLVGAYFILEVGELCLSPIGLSAVTALSVPTVVSLMMGAWFLGTACSEALAHFFGKFAAVDIAEGAAINYAEVSAKYENLFWLMTWIGIGCAVVALVLAPLIRRWMGRLADA